MPTPLLVDCEIGIYSPTGTPRNLNEGLITQGVSWEYLENGGMGRATIPVQSRFEADAHSSSRILPGDTVKIWVAGETYPRYIGTLSEPQRTLSIPETFAYTAYGEMERMNSIQLIRQQIAKPGGADLAVFAQELLDDYNAKRGTSYTGDFQTTGITLDLLGLDRASARAGFDELFRIAQGGIVWGWEVNPANGQIRMYLRPRTASIGWQKSVGEGVRLVGERVPLSDCYNTLTPVIGGEGRAKFPNTLGEVVQTSDGKANSRFDYPVPAGTLANCIVNSALVKGGGFIHPVFWTPSGSVWNGAAGREDSDGVRLTPGDYIQQTRQNVNQSQAQKIQPGHTYRIGVWGRQEVGGDTRAVTVTLKWLNSGGTQIGSTETFTFQPDAALWEEYADPLNTYPGLQSTAPTSATGFEVKLLGAATGSGTAVFVDDPYLYDVSATSQPGWECYDPGANLTSIDWSYDDGYNNAPYCVRIIAGSGTSSGDGDNISLRPVDGGRPRVAPGQNIRIGVWYKSGPGATATPELRLRSSFRTSGGDNAEYSGFSPVDNYYTVGSSGTATADWTFLGDSYIATGSTASIEYAIQVNGPGDVLFSCALVMDNASTSYYPGSTFERPVDVTDASISRLLTSDALASITSYGKRETSLTIETVTDWDSVAQRDVAAWLNKHAALFPERTLELDNDTALITPGTGTRLRVSGVEESLSDQWPSRVTCTWTGKLAQAIELGDPAPQLSTVLIPGTSTGGGGNVSSGNAGNSAIPTLTVPVLVAQGGTGATDAATARTNLGLGSGLSVTVPLAKLTGGGANGSLTFTNGILTGRVDPT